MKKILNLMILLLSSVGFAQNESVYVSIGKPWFPDKESNLNNFSLGLNYQNRFSQSFALDLYLEYNQSNDFPRFFDDATAVDNYLMDQTYSGVYFNSLWSKINTVTVGTKVDYLFVNNDQFLFNFNLGAGYLFSYSRAHDVKNWTYDFNNGQILTYENGTTSGNLNTFYYTLGLQFQGTFYKNYFVGISPYYLMPIGEKKINSIPVYPNHYNLTLNIGKRF